MLGKWLGFGRPRYQVTDEVLAREVPTERLWKNKGTSLEDVQRMVAAYRFPSSRLQSRPPIKANEIIRVLGTEISKPRVDAKDDSGERAELLLFQFLENAVNDDSIALPNKQAANEWLAARRALDAIETRDDYDRTSLQSRTQFAQEIDSERWTLEALVESANEI